MDTPSAQPEPIIHSETTMAMSFKEPVANVPVQPSHRDVNRKAEGNSSTQTSRFQCRVCHEPFPDYWLLDNHAGKESHATYICGQPGCDCAFTTSKSCTTHESHTHTADHCQIQGLLCAECNTQFMSQTEFLTHVKTEKHHTPFTCRCGTKFDRTDALYRHLDKFSKSKISWGCSFCKRHRGKRSFHRRDHLVQHLRGYHKFEPEEIDKISPKYWQLRQNQILVCPHAGCEFHRDEAFKSLSWTEQNAQKPFTKQSDYSKHMKDVHKETPFPCHMAECDRVGAKGYMREKDLMKHLAGKHPEAPEYLAKPRRLPMYECKICDKGFTTFQTLEDHNRSKTHKKNAERVKYSQQGK
ncbi:hypothetical protein F5B20DRAFT_555465 [Whalleya microplaca]|nr:hypothetical protein F5B20DRAFT_555465 [Whalleya microplaca]